MHYKLLIALTGTILLRNNLLAQEPIQQALVTGHIFSPDSQAIEDAYLISYKTLRAFATNKRGEFDVLIQPDDSLKIHHVAYQPIIIKPDSTLHEQIIVMQFEENFIEDVDIRNEALEIKLHF